MSKKHSYKIVVCPRCGLEKNVRSDSLKFTELKGLTWHCKPCRNQTRFENKPHPKKGTGVKNNPELLRTRNSFYKAKQRCKLGAKHHPAYENVEFKFSSFQEFLDEVGIRPEGCTLDRINTSGHYEHGNVRWATAKEQAANRVPRGTWKVE